MVSILLAASLLRPGPMDITLSVDGVDRKAIIYRSNGKERTSPLVFVFHGFMGNARQASISYHVQDSWPEATVIYPQGLDVNLLGRSGPGWQIASKMQDSRDVKFFDALLKKAKTDYSTDAKRTYTCGMSNGAIFSYVLLTERAGSLAGAAPVAGFAAGGFKGAPATPILIIHGTKDNLLTIQSAERSRAMAIANNGVGKTEKEWMPGYVQYTPAPEGNDVIWHQHDGGHIWPSDATEAIVKFFKGHRRKD